MVDRGVLNYIQTRPSPIRNVSFWCNGLHFHDIASAFHHGKSEGVPGLDFMDSFAISIKGLSDLAKASVGLWDFLAEICYFLPKGNRLHGVWQAVWRRRRFLDNIFANGCRCSSISW